MHVRRIVIFEEHLIMMPPKIAFVGIASVLSYPKSSAASGSATGA